MRKQYVLTALLLGLCFLLAMLLTSSPVLGELQEMSKNELRTIRGQEGLSFSVNLGVNADYFEITDGDGTYQGSATNSAGAFRLGNFSLTSGSRTTMTMDVDGTNGLIFDIPQSSAGEMQLTIDDIVATGDPTSSSLNTSTDLGKLYVQGLQPAYHPDGSSSMNLEVQADDEGLVLSGQIDLFAEAINWHDPDGTGNAPNDGLGNIILQDVHIDNGFGGQINFSGLDLNVDGGEGLVAQMPTGFYIDIRIGQVCSFSFSEWDECYYNEFATDVTFGNIDLGNSTLVLGAPSFSQGVTLDGSIKLGGGGITDISLTDDDGTPLNSSSGTLNFSEIRFTDASDGSGSSGGGGPVEIDSAAELHVDGDGGIVLEAPSFAVSGDGHSAHDNPDNELYIHNINVNDSCFGDRCGEWMLRNFDPGGSWMKVSGH